MLQVNTLYNFFMFTTFGRIIRNGFKGFYRNRTISISAIVVMTITMMIIGGLIYSRAMLKHVLVNIQNKVDVTAYFVLSSEEEEILNLKAALEKLPEVKSIVYTSRQQALENYKQKNSNDALALQALDEIGENPFRASLDIKAQNSGQYEAIANFLKSEQLDEANRILIDKVDYSDNKEIIDRLNSLIDTVQRVGITIASIFVLISIMITYNTIRLAIYSFRDEISIMRLVGADKSYVHGPFVIEGVIYGALSAILAMILFLPISLYIRDYVSDALIQFDTFEFYKLRGVFIGLLLLGTGVVLGTISSFLAVRRYLRK